MRYEPTRVLSLRKLLPQVRSLVPSQSALVDLGCGKGRVLLLAAQAGFAMVRGVEFAGELCEIARQNCARFRAASGLETTFEVIHADVTQYPIRPDESVFFLFNPFDVVIFERVLSAIIRSWQSAPRAILIVILLPTVAYREAIARRAEFAFARCVRSWGYDFCLYTVGETKPSGATAQREH